MASTFFLTLCLGMLVVCLAVPISNIRWCVKSEKEQRKCSEIKHNCACDKMPMSCVLKASTEDCITAIADGFADAMTLDSGDIYRASMNPYNLKPILAENYGTEKDADTCYYAVALVKKSTDFMFKDLKGKTSCHTAVGRVAGWYVPVGVLLDEKQITWGGPEEQPVEKVVSGYFSASCAPGAKEENMCKQCAGLKDKKCKQSESEPFFGYAGAQKCVKEGKGHVGFMKHKMPVDLHQDHELLCRDNTRKPISEYEKCYWGRVPAHAVVTVQDEDKIKAIIEFFQEAKNKPGCKLFSSSHGTDLMFKDSATDLIPLPSQLDTFLYLGRKFYNAFKALHKVELEKTKEDKIRWCTVSKEEKSKCDTWTIVSGGAIECVEASLADECTTKIMKGEADAFAMDGGYLYTAGACGLVPAMTEIYDARECKGTGSTTGSYFAVAVIKASNTDITWNNLRGKKSCHTAVGRTAGWVIPVGHIHKESGICDMSTYFKESCAPGAPGDSNLCKLCVGDPQKSVDGTKCSANNKELYYGYEGAFRCMVETGDVSFVKHTTVFEIINANPRWLKGMKLDDFRLLCRDGSVKPVSEYKTCHLAEVPAHAVACLAEKKELVVRILKEQLNQFGKKRGDPDQAFHMFESEGRRDQLFKDSTECLREIKTGDMYEFLGKEYTDAVSSLNNCTKSELLKACTFHTCKI